MKILFAASEAAPFIKTGGLGDIGCSLPKALAEAGHEVKVFVPLYGKIKHSEVFAPQLEYITNFYTSLAWRNQYTGLFRCGNIENNLEYIFIDNEYYFCRHDDYNIYGDYDDGEKFAFFSKAILEALPKINFIPDIIHCNDWQTALIPLFLHSFYSHYGNVKTVFTIHNIEYQGKMIPEFAHDVLALNDEDINVITYDNCVNFMKSAIVRADAITTVSESYAGEILNEFFAHNLENILRENQYKLTGIINGIDQTVFDPSTDANLFLNYSFRSFGRKEKNKLSLQKKLGLTVNPNIPLLIMVSRFVSHKGLDLVERVLDEIIDCGVQLAVLGTGDRRYEKMFVDACLRRDGKIAAIITFDPALASQMYAGADMFLMPSLSEPCGLSQLVAMRYGCVPIVRETGGLRDTVPAYNPQTQQGRGFTFENYNAHEMLHAISRCADLYRNDIDSFKNLGKQNMKCDFSWSASVGKYEEVYNNLINS